MCNLSLQGFIQVIKCSTSARDLSDGTGRLGDLDSVLRVLTLAPRLVELCWPRIAERLARAVGIVLLVALFEEYAGFRDPGLVSGKEVVLEPAP